jgi:hypothetical protein
MIAVEGAVVAVWDDSRRVPGSARDKLYLATSAAEVGVDKRFRFFAAEKQAKLTVGTSEVNPLPFTCRAFQGRSFTSLWVSTRRAGRWFAEGIRAAERATA